MKNSQDANKQTAINISCSNQTSNPILDFLNPHAAKKRNPFLRKMSFILPHREALKIIKDLEEFYENHSPEDIKNINLHLKNFIAQEM